MTIAICDIQFEDINAQQITWTKFNETMLKHGFPKPNFKIFMVDSAQANWNMVKIVYGVGVPFVKMVDKETHVYSIGLNRSISTPNN
jgi:hypothetical protein